MASLNPFKPNILDDMMAAARGRWLGRVTNTTPPKPIPRAPGKVYPYASQRQRTRGLRRLGVTVLA